MSIADMDLDDELSIEEIDAEMTNEEAIEELENRKEHYEMGEDCEILVVAMDRGIKALKKNLPFEMLENNEVKKEIDMLNVELITMSTTDDTDILNEMKLSIKTRLDKIYKINNERLKNL